MLKEYTKRFTKYTQYFLDNTPDFNLFIDPTYDYFVVIEEGHEIYKTKDELDFIKFIEDLATTRNGDLPQRVEEFKKLKEIYTTLEKCKFDYIDVADLLDHILEEMYKIEDEAGVADMLDLV